MTSFGYEIDFLPVGDGEASGDAVAVRYGHPGAYTVMVVDGGTLDSGRALVEHINRYYGAPSKIDHVVCTHPDGDHSSGLREVIQSFDVGAVWMHRPWLYAKQLVHRFKGNWSVEGLRKRLREDFPIVREISDYAEEKGIPIYEPFQGAQIGAFTILSPAYEFYLNLVPQFDRTPEPAVQRAQEGLAGLLAQLGTMTKAAAQKVVNWLTETWFHETLKEDSETSATNESCVVLYAKFEDRHVLLTADAGIQALTAAADYADTVGIQLQDFRFVQVPHHGSRHNVSPSILDRLIGPTVLEGGTIQTTAIASAAKESETHPRRVVLNAFRRRGVQVSSTKGKTVQHRYNMPERDGWGPVISYEFFSQVEGD